MCLEWSNMLIYNAVHHFFDEFFVIIVSLYILKYLLEALTLKRQIWILPIKIHKKFLQFYEISKGHFHKVLLQKVT